MSKTPRAVIRNTFNTLDTLIFKRIIRNNIYTPRKVINARYVITYKGGNK